MSRSISRERELRDVLPGLTQDEIDAEMAREPAPTPQPTEPSPTPQAPQPRQTEQPLKKIRRIEPRNVRQIEELNAEQVLAFERRYARKQERSHAQVAATIPHANDEDISAAMIANEENRQVTGMAVCREILNMQSPTPQRPRGRAEQHTRDMENNPDAPDGEVFESNANVAQKVTLPLRGIRGMDKLADFEKAGQGRGAAFISGARDQFVGLAQMSANAAAGSRTVTVPQAQAAQPPAPAQGIRAGPAPMADPSERYTPEQFIEQFHEEDANQFDVMRSYVRNRFNVYMRDTGKLPTEIFLMSDKGQDWMPFKTAFIFRDGWENYNQNQSLWNEVLLEELEAIRNRYADRNPPDIRDASPSVHVHRPSLPDEDDEKRASPLPRFETDEQKTARLNREMAMGAQFFDKLKNRQHVDPTLTSFNQVEVPNSVNLADPDVANDDGIVANAFLNEHLHEMIEREQDAAIHDHPHPAHLDAADGRADDFHAQGPLDHTVVETAEPEPEPYRAYEDDVQQTATRFADDVLRDPYSEDSHDEKRAETFGQGYANDIMNQSYVPDPEDQKGLGEDLFPVARRRPRSRSRSRGNRRFENIENQRPTRRVRSVGRASGGGPPPKPVLSDKEQQALRAAARASAPTSSRLNPDPVDVSSDAVAAPQKKMPNVADPENKPRVPNFVLPSRPPPKRRRIRAVSLQNLVAPPPPAPAPKVRRGKGGKRKGGRKLGGDGSGLIKDERTDMAQLRRDFANALDRVKQKNDAIWGDNTPVDHRVIDYKDPSWRRKVRAMKVTRGIRGMSADTYLRQQQEKLDAELRRAEGHQPTVLNNGKNVDTQPMSRDFQITDEEVLSEMHLPHYLNIPAVGALSKADQAFVAKHFTKGRFPERFKRRMKKSMPSSRSDKLKHVMEMKNVKTILAAWKKHNHDPVSAPSTHTDLNELISRVESNKPSNVSMKKYMKRALTVEAVAKCMPGAAAEDIRAMRNKTLQKYKKKRSSRRHRPVNHQLQQAMAQTRGDDVRDMVTNVPPTPIPIPKDPMKAIADADQKHIENLKNVTRNIQDTQHARAQQHTNQSRILRHPHSAVSKNPPSAKPLQTDRLANYPAIVGLSAISDLDLLMNKLRDYKNSLQYKPQIGNAMIRIANELLNEQEDMSRALQDTQTVDFAVKDMKVISRLVSNHAQKVYKLIDTYNHVSNDKFIGQDYLDAFDREPIQDLPYGSGDGAMAVWNRIRKAQTTHGYVGTMSGLNMRMPFAGEEMLWNNQQVTVVDPANARGRNVQGRKAKFNPQQYAYVEYGNTLHMVSLRDLTPAPTVLPSFEEIAKMGFKPATNVAVPVSSGSIQPKKTAPVKPLATNTNVTVDQTIQQCMKAAADLKGAKRAIIQSAKNAKKATQFKNNPQDAIIEKAVTKALKKINIKIDQIARTGKRHMQAEMMRNARAMNAKNSINEHVERDKIAQDKAGMYGVGHHVHAGQRRDILSKAAAMLHTNHKYPDAWKPVMDHLHKKLTTAEMNQFKHAVAKEGKDMIEYAEFMIQNNGSKEDLMHKVHRAITNKKVNQDLRHDMPKVSVPQTSLDGLHRARTKVPKMNHAHVHSPRAKPKPVKHATKPTIVKPTAEMALATFKRTRTHDRVAKAVPGLQRQNKHAHRPGRSENQKPPQPMPENIEPPSEVETKEVQSDVARRARKSKRPTRIIDEALKTHPDIQVAIPRTRERSPSQFEREAMIQRTRPAEVGEDLAAPVRPRRFRAPRFTSPQRKRGGKPIYLQAANKSLYPKLDNPVMTKPNQRAVPLGKPVQTGGVIVDALTSSTPTGAEAQAMTKPAGLSKGSNGTVFQTPKNPNPSTAAPDPFEQNSMPQPPPPGSMLPAMPGFMKPYFPSPKPGDSGMIYYPAKERETPKGVQIKDAQGVIQADDDQKGIQPDATNPDGVRVAIGDPETIKASLKDIETLYSTREIDGEQMLARLIRLQERHNLHPFVIDENEQVHNLKLNPQHLPNNMNVTAFAKQYIKNCRENWIRAVVGQPGFDSSQRQALAARALARLHTIHELQVLGTRKPGDPKIKVEPGTGTTVNVQLDMMKQLTGGTDKIQQMRARFKAGNPTSQDLSNFRQLYKSVRSRKVHKMDPDNTFVDALNNSKYRAMAGLPSVEPLLTLPSKSDKQLAMRIMDARSKHVTPDPKDVRRIKAMVRDPQVAQYSEILNLPDVQMLLREQDVEYYKRVPKKQYPLTPTMLMMNQRIRSGTMRPEDIHRLRKYDQMIDEIIPFGLKYTNEEALEEYMNLPIVTEFLRRTDRKASGRLKMGDPTVKGYKQKLRQKKFKRGGPLPDMRKPINLDAVYDPITNTMRVPDTVYHPEFGMVPRDQQKYDEMMRNMQKQWQAMQDTASTKASVAAGTPAVPPPGTPAIAPPRPGTPAIPPPGTPAIAPPKKKKKKIDPSPAHPKQVQHKEAPDDDTTEDPRYSTDVYHTKQGLYDWQLWFDYQKLGYKYMPLSDKQANLFMRNKHRFDQLVAAVKGKGINIKSHNLIASLTFVHDMYKNQPKKFESLDSKKGRYGKFFKSKVWQDYLKTENAMDIELVPDPKNPDPFRTPFPFKITTEDGGFKRAPTKDFTVKDRDILNQAMLDVDEKGQIMPENVISQYEAMGRTELARLLRKYMAIKGVELDKKLNAQDMREAEAFMEGAEEKKTRLNKKDQDEFTKLVDDASDDPKKILTKAEVDAMRKKNPALADAVGDAMEALRLEQRVENRSKKKKPATRPTTPAKAPKPPKPQTPASGSKTIQNDRQKVSPPRPIKQERRIKQEPDVQYTGMIKPEPRIGDPDVDDEKLETAPDTGGGPLPSLGGRGISPSTQPAGAPIPQGVVPAPGQPLNNSPIDANPGVLPNLEPSDDEDATVYIGRRLRKRRARKPSGFYRDQDVSEAETSHPKRRGYKHIPNRRDPSSGPSGPSSRGSSRSGSGRSGSGGSRRSGRSGSGTPIQPVDGGSPAPTGPSGPGGSPAPTGPSGGSPGRGRKLDKDIGGPEDDEKDDGGTNPRDKRTTRQVTTGSTRPRQVQHVAIPIGMTIQDCPTNFVEQNVMKEVGMEWGGPLFKYAYVGDLIRDFDIKQHIWIRVTKSLIEAVVLQGAKDFEIRCLAFMLNHVEGHFLVNTPVPEDGYKLKQIMKVTKETRDSDVSKAIFRELYEYPTHLVLYSDFNVANSSIMPLIASRKTAIRIADAFR